MPMKMYPLYWRVFYATLIWDPSLPEIECIQNIVNSHFENLATQVLGRHQDMDRIIKSLMENGKTVVIPGRFPADHTQDYDAKYRGWNHPHKTWPYFVPMRTPESTDYLYLPPTPETLEDVYAGHDAHRGKALIILPASVPEHYLSSLTYRNKLLNVVVLIQSTAYTWFPYDPPECHYIGKTMVPVGTCNHTGNLYPNKVKSTLSGCPLVFLYITEKACPPLAPLSDNNRLLLEFPNPELVKYPMTEVLSSLIRALNFTIAHYSHEDWYPKWQEIYGEKAIYLEHESGKNQQDFPNISIAKTYYSRFLLGTMDYYHDFLFHCHFFIPSNIDSMAQQIATKGFEMTVPYHELSRKWLIPKPTIGLPMMGLVAGLTWEIWSLVLLSLIAFSLLSMSMMMMSDNSKNNKKEDASLTSFFNTLAFLSMQSVSGISKTDLAFILYAIHISAFYQIQLLSNIFKPSLLGDYQTIEEASDSYEFAWDTLVYDYFDIRNNTKMKTRFWYDFKRVDKKVSLDSLKQRTTLIMEEEVRLCLESKKCAMMSLFEWWIAGHYGKKVLKEPAHTQYAIFLTTWGHPLLPRVNDIMSRLVEAGITDFCVSTQQNYLRVMYLDIVTESGKTLTTFHMQSMFYLLLFSLFACFFVFCWEVRRSHSQKILNTN